MPIWKEALWKEHHLSINDWENYFIKWLFESKPINWMVFFSCTVVHINMLALCMTVTLTKLLRSQCFFHLLPYYKDRCSISPLLWPPQDRPTLYTVILCFVLLLLYRCYIKHGICSILVLGMDTEVQRCRWCRWHTDTWMCRRVHDTCVCYNRCGIWG